MKIGMVSPYSFDFPGGVQIHALDLCEEFRRRGHEVSLIGPAGKDVDLPDFVERGGHAIPIPYNGSVARLAFGPVTAWKVRRWIKKGDFDVLHVHEPNSPSYSMLAVNAALGPVVATYHSAATRSRVLKVALPLLRPVLERIRGGIAVSEVARRWQVEQLGGDPVLIPNGVNVGTYVKAAGLDDPAMAADAGIGPTEPGRKRLVFLGRFDESRKGLSVLLDALPETAQRYPNIEIVVIGDGDRDSAIAKAGEHAPLLNFVGRVSEQAKTAILASADIYIAPQRGGESFGIVLVEAMAAGTAVLASDLDAFRLVLSEGQSGVLFRNGDSADLARKIAMLLDDDELRASYVTAGSSRAWDFDWSSIADRVLQVYQTVRTPGERVVVD